MGPDEVWPIGSRVTHILGNPKSLGLMGRFEVRSILATKSLVADICITICTIAAENRLVQWAVDRRTYFSLLPQLIEALVPLVWIAST